MKSVAEISDEHSGSNEHVIPGSGDDEVKIDDNDKESNPRALVDKAQQNLDRVLKIPESVKCDIPDLAIPSSTSSDIKDDAHLDGDQPIQPIHNQASKPILRRNLFGESSTPKPAKSEDPKTEKKPLKRKVRQRHQLQSG